MVMFLESGSLVIILLHWIYCFCFTLVVNRYSVIPGHVPHHRAEIKHASEGNKHGIRLTTDDAIGSEAVP